MTATPAHEIPLAIRRKAVAVHEAGHALVARYLKRPVAEVVLRAPHGLSGATRFEGEDAVVLDLSVKADRQYVQDAIVILLAGQIAEAEYWRTLAPLYVPAINSHRTDDFEIRKLQAQLGLSHDHNSMLMGYCTDLARQIALHEKAQAAIAEIADHLAEALAIGRAALDDILLRHGVVQGQLKLSANPWQRRI
ncbi:hypothetical protein ABLE93_17525 [Xanthobacter sp. KR7-65]|uniref:hypothetical protein n=1 Tax=Xanthobacter sp. KR7-65 TaxID=3156612 RepID=UPI0032B5B5B2